MRVVFAEEWPQLTGDWISIHEWTVGSAETCALRFDDPTGRISRLHARLVHERSKWFLRDLGSKSGIKLDGAYHPQFVLEPGVEIGIGGVTLVAESLRWIKLREFLARLLGWRVERIKVIDHALRSIRTSVGVGGRAPDAARRRSRGGTR